ncbi:MAG: efflux RND transporter periplasmic adaptor subunit [Acidipila sp.]|nr:efflux RND transporter periplasmic adaptor subunit [Acidipila sp.]
MSGFYPKQPGVRTSRGLRGVVPATICALSLALIAGGCGKKEATASHEAPAVAVQTMVVAPVAIADSSEYLATLKSRHSTALNPQVEGQVTHVFVKSGDRVAAGEPIMQIDPLKQQAQVMSQEAPHAAQSSNVDLAKIQAERAKKLFDAGVISKQDYDQAQTNLNTAQQQNRSLDAQVREQQVQLRYYRVTAPTAGVVGDVPVRVGDRVTVSTLLTTIDQAGSLELYINVPVERSKDLNLGQTVNVLDGNGAVAAESRIDFISPEVDSSSQSILVKATVRNSSGALRNAQFTRARIIWGVRKGPALPVLAVSRINGQFFVFVVEGSGKSLVARQRILRLGELTNNLYPVLDGLKLGDRVVVQGAQNLTDGDKVTEPGQDSNGKPSS